MSEMERMARVDDLFESLAEAIDEVRGDRSGSAANELEKAFLARLAFLALQQLDDTSRQRQLIATAMRRKADSSSH